MNDNVTPITENLERPDLGAILEAQRTFARSWQNGKLRDMPLLFEAVERHAQLLSGAKETLANQAMGLEAELKSGQLSSILHELNDGVSDELLEYAMGAVIEIHSQLSRQAATVQASARDLEALPTMNAAPDEARLSSEAQALEAGKAKQSASVEAARAKLEEVDKAIKALEAVKNEADFNGTVPTAEQLMALATPGGKAKVAAELASNALKDLQKALGKLVSGMTYGRLQEERGLLASHLSELQQEVSDNDRQAAHVKAQLQVLTEVPTLMTLRGECIAALNVMTLALERVANRIEGEKQKGVEGLRQIDGLCQQALGYQSSVLEQIRKDF